MVPSTPDRQEWSDVIVKTRGRFDRRGVALSEQTTPYFQPLHRFSRCPIFTVQPECDFLAITNTMAPVPMPSALTFELLGKCSVRA